MLHLKPLVLALFASAALASAQPPAPAAAPKPDPWQPLRGLVGSWEGDAQGEPGTGTTEREYRFVLNDRFIRVDNRSTYAPQPKNPKGEVHEDVGYLSADQAAGKLVLRQFHVEGFVSHYVLDSVSEDGRTIVFTSVAIENVPSGFRARETWRIVGADAFVETFALAEP